MDLSQIIAVILLLLAAFLLGIWLLILHWEKPKWKAKELLTDAEKKEIVLEFLQENDLIVTSRDKNKNQGS